MVKGDYEICMELNPSTSNIVDFCTTKNTHYAWNNLRQMNFGFVSQSIGGDPPLLNGDYEICMEIPPSNLK